LLHRAVDRLTVTRGSFLTDIRDHVLRDFFIVYSLLKLGDIIALRGIKN
jgi:hypothetical protein